MIDTKDIQDVQDVIEEAGDKISRSLDNVAEAISCLGVYDGVGPGALLYIAQALERLAKAVEDRP